MNNRNRKFLNSKGFSKKNLPAVLSDEDLEALRKAAYTPYFLGEDDHHGHNMAKTPNNSPLTQSSTQQIYNALHLSEEDLDDFPDMKAGSSFKGEKVNRSLQSIENTIPPGYKEMIIFDKELKTICKSIQLENTPELTQDEYEKYSRFNPQ